MRNWNRAAQLLLPVVALLAAGCSSGPPPVTQAPPVGPAYGNQQPGAPPVAQGGAGVYQWQDVPLNQQVPITRAVFDQGGYQLFAQSGETIVVPFANQNLYVMKFGQTNGAPYFVNEGSAPVYYLPPGGSLENAAAQGARWFPFSQSYAYRQPVYIGLAPTWADYTGMGWYPGMSYYGGMWGLTPYHPMWMPGFYVSIGGARYSSYNSYRTYYTTHGNYLPQRMVYNNYGGRSTGSFGSGRSSSGFGRSSGSTGSFGSGRGTGFGTGRSATGSTGSFGGGRSSGFGGSSSTARSSFGGGSNSSTLGGSRSSFGGGGSGFSNTPRASGGSFGGGRSSGGSFGGGRSSGGSFGGGRSSFGGGRRR